jgi:hypothetical protein
MLRDFITGTQWGMDVTPTTAGSFWSHTFEYDIPAHFNNIEVVQKDLAFIAFVAENEKTIISGAKAEVAFGTYYKIMATAGENGAISPEGEVDCWGGTNPVYTFTPDPGYEVAEVFVNDVPMGLAQASEYIFPEVEENCNIHVVFKLIGAATYTITATAGEGGSISPEGETEYTAGETATYIITPNSGYEFDELYLDDVHMATADPITEYSFVVTGDHTLYVTFKLIDGIRDMTGTAISIAPNPMNDKLFITGAYDKFEIFSISGQVLATVFNQPAVDVSNLSKGIYIVKIQTNGQTTTFKVVK